MAERKSDVFFSSLLAGGVLMGLMFMDAAISRHLDVGVLRERREIVRVLTLTDLCLFTEARYTRHPSLADLHTPFQEHPMSLEHFPSGAIMAVPPHLKDREGSPRPSSFQEGRLRFAPLAWLNSDSQTRR